VTAFQGLIDGLGAGRKTPLQGRERKANCALALAVRKPVGLVHFFLHIFGDSGVKRGFKRGQLVVDRVGPPFGEERSPVKFEEFLLDHAAHKIGHVNLVCTIAKLAVEPV